MNLEQFNSLVSQARSCRRYVSADAIPADLVLKLVDTARQTPSGMNAQPLRYRIVTDSKECEQVFNCTNWAKGLRTGPAPTPAERPTAYIVVCSAIGSTDLTAVDVGIASQTIQLAATAAGYAACMLASVDRAALHKALNLPQYIQVNLLLALGRPGEVRVLETLAPGAPTAYWRTHDQVHHVPKRRLDEILIR